MFDNEMTNEAHEPFSRAVSPSCFSQLSKDNAIETITKANEKKNKSQKLTKSVAFLRFDIWKEILSSSNRSELLP